MLPKSADLLYCEKALFDAENLLHVSFEAAVNVVYYFLQPSEQEHDLDNASC